MKTVVLAYHEVGCAGLAFLKEAGAEITASLPTKTAGREPLVWLRRKRAKDYALPIYAPNGSTTPNGSK